MKYSNVEEDPGSNQLVLSNSHVIETWILTGARDHIGMLSRVVGSVGSARHGVIMASTCKYDLHTKCRGKYAGGVERFPVPDDKVSWSIDWPEYKPVDYTAPRVGTDSSRIDADYR